MVSWKLTFGNWNEMRINIIHCNISFFNSPLRGKCGMRSAWGGEIGGTGVDNWGNPGMSVDSALMPIQRPLTSSTNSDKLDRLDQFKETSTNLQQVK